MSYPEKILRGISDKNWIADDGTISAAAFQFSPNPERTDDFEEASINWHDDEGALNFLLSKKKENSDTIQFKGGVAILSKQIIDTLKNLPAFKTSGFSYERNPIKGNDYHGNFLRNITISKQLKTLISSSIALSVERIIPAPSQQQ